MSNDGLPNVGTLPEEQLGLAIVKDWTVRPVSGGELGCILRELPTADVGLDAQLEIVHLEESGRAFATGRILSMQVKAGSSYFSRTDEEAWLVYIPNATVRYWQSHSVPVILVLVNTETREAFWTRADGPQGQEGRKTVRMRVPKRQRYGSSSRAALVDLAENTTEEDRKRARLEGDVPLMKAAASGEDVVMDVTVWVNKYSGRMDYKLGVRSLDHHDDGPEGMRTFVTGSVIGTGGDLMAMAEHVVPWAEPASDWEFEEMIEGDLYREYLAETGTRDDETGVMIDSRGTFDSWREARREGRESPLPYYTDGEIESFRLSLSPKALAESYLEVRRFTRGEP